MIAALGLYAIALAWTAWLFATAPEGFEDSTGWHAGKPGPYRHDAGTSRPMDLTFHSTADSPGGQQNHVR